MPTAIFQIDGAARGQLLAGQINQSTGRVLVDIGSGGSGTVTSVAVETANGFAGTVADPTTDAQITLETTITGILQGNGTAISAASTTGSGNVVLATAPTISGATITTSTVNGVTLTTGGGTTTFLNANGAYSTPSASATSVTVGTTTVLSGTSTRILFDNAGVLGEYTISGSGSVAMTTSPTFSNPTVGTQATTDNSTLAASTAYVTTAINNAIAGVNPAVAVQAATTAASDTSGFTYNNGVSGVGATFTGTTNTAITIDGFTFTALGQRLLVKNDTQSPSGAFNGVYYVTQVQTGILPPILTRALDYDTPSDMNNTGAIPVVNGTANANTSWLLTSTVVTVGTTPLTYVQFSLAPSSIVTLTGTQTLTNKTLTTPVLNGTVTGTSVSATSGTSTILQRDTNGNVQTNNFIEGFTTTATAAGTTTLTVTSSYYQMFTGSTTQTVFLPVASTLALGTTYFIKNSSSGTVTVQSSGANTVASVAAGATVIVTSILTSGTTAASWNANITANFYSPGKTATFSNSLTFAGTDGTTLTFPSTSATIARTDAAQTFTGTQTFSQQVTTVNAITASANAATVPITSRISNVTNNSAATLTITMTTASAVDGMLVMVRIFDSSAVAQTLTFVNTENSTVSVPATSNGSTTLPLTVGFQYNSATSKWRCIAVS